MFGSLYLRKSCRPTPARFSVGTIQCLGLRVVTLLAALLTALLASHFLTDSSPPSSRPSGGCCCASIFSMTVLGTCSKYVPVAFMIEPPSLHSTVAVRQAYGENLLDDSREKSAWFSAMGRGSARWYGG